MITATVGSPGCTARLLPKITAYESAASGIETYDAPLVMAEIDGRNCDDTVKD